MRKREADRGWRKSGRKRGREDILCVGEEECKTEMAAEIMHGNERGETTRGI